MTGTKRCCAAISRSRWRGIAEAVSERTSAIRGIFMRISLSLLFAVHAARSASAFSAERVLLKEDFQVLQRDATDEATCTVVLPDSLAGAPRVSVTVDDARGKRLRK